MLAEDWRHKDLIVDTSVRHDHVQQPEGLNRTSLQTNKTFVVPNAFIGFEVGPRGDL